MSETYVNAVADGVADDTAALQAAIDECRSLGGGTVRLPAGTLRFTQLRFYPNVSLVGVSMAASGYRASRLVQAGGFDGSALVNDPTALPVGEYCHWVRLARFELRKESGTATVGSGIELNCRSGEGFHIEGVTARGFPEAGVRFRRGGAPLKIDGLHLFGNGVYGLDLQRTTSDTWQMVSVRDLSGDDNVSALVRVKTAGATGESFVFRDVKAEGTATTQPDTFLLDGLNGSPVHVDHSSSVGIGSNLNSVVRIEGSSPRLYLTLPRGEAVTNLIDDNVAPRDVAWASNYFDLGYHSTPGVAFSRSI